MKHLLLLLLVCLCYTVSAQRNLEDSVIGTPWCSIHYGANWTGGDYAKKFGFTNHLGGTIAYKTNKNWVLGFDGNFIFGNKVRMPDLFANLVDSYGNITDQNGDVALVVVNQRGFNVNAMVGKVIPVLSNNKNSGIYINAGIGYVQSKIHIETENQVIPTLETKYRKGYDHYTTGVNLSQFVGYAFLSNHGIVNFYGGFYMQEGFTKNRRNVFFDTPDTPVPTNVLLELQYGVRFGWFIPIYKRQPKDFYFN